MTKKNGGRSAARADARLLRAASVRSQSFDDDARTVEVVWTTGAAVERMSYDGDYIEVLSLDAGAVRLDRLNMGAPFLNTHSSWDLSDVIGSVVSGSARIEGDKGIAKIQLSGAAADADTVGKIRDGVIRNISVGYIVHAFTERTVDGVTTRTVTDWEPLEISAVPIPADPGSQIRAHGHRRSAAKRAAPRSPAQKPVSRRIADIKRWAAKAGMRNFGAQHIRAGTTADDFFWLLAERLTGTRKAETMSTKTKEQREFEAGRRAAERILGRSPKRDDDTKKDDQDDDGEDDRDETCPTCGQPIVEDDHDDDADEAEDDKDRDDASDEDDDRSRNLRSGRRVHATPGRDFRSSPAKTERRDKAPVPGGGLNLDRGEMARGAAEFRKLTGKR